MGINKNLLIIAQTVDRKDSNLGFFCGWLEEFAKQLDNVYVIANKVGEYGLPKNVKVLSLGKENGAGRLKRVFKFWIYLFKYLFKTKAVFVHMCPEYIVYGGFVARLFGKKLGLWYLHKSLTWKLALANILANSIFTAHADGVPIKSSKVIVTGHGINTGPFENMGRKPDNSKFTILTVGRISKSKNLLILVKSAILLQQKLSKQVDLIIVGEPYLPEDKAYLRTLQKYIQEKNAGDRIEFVGKVYHEQIADYYKKADVFLNASDTGGVDKAVLEAMASGVPVITSNIAFKNILPNNCLFENNDLDGLMEGLSNYKEIDTKSLRAIVINNHNLKNTIKKIISNLQPTSY